MQTSSLEASYNNPIPISQSFTSATHFTQEEVITQPPQIELEQHSYSSSLTTTCLNTNFRQANINFKENIQKPNSNIHQSVALDKCETGDLSTQPRQNHSAGTDISGDKANRPLNSILKKEKHTTCKPEEQHVGSDNNVNCTDLSNLPSSYNDITKSAQDCAVKR
jgi:hypothetical protein